jgi:hypothetical protein
MQKLWQGEEKTKRGRKRERKWEKLDKSVGLVS